MNDQQLLQYYQNQQSRSGWFSLLHVMIEGMVANVGEAQSHPFLVQMGETLAERFPLTPAHTVGELEAQINARLAAFDWGVIDIDASDTAIRISHMALPVPAEPAQQRAWNHAFSAVLEGLYARWMREQGGKSHVSLWREASPSATVIHFRYQNNQ
ncbi:Cellulose synthase operon protein D [compost metagenome]